MLIELMLIIVMLSEDFLYASIGCKLKGYYEQSQMDSLMAGQMDGQKVFESRDYHPQLFTSM